MNIEIRNKYQKDSILIIWLGLSLWIGLGLSIPFKTFLI